jgi:pimeloyl-ACP methyl ester carboxylesterase
MMRVHALLKLNIGGIEQSLLVRGRSRSNPVLLLLQAGPGFPIINEARALQRTLRLEDEFVVAYWDQRGSGKSFNGSVPADSMHLDQMVADTRDVLAELRRWLDVEHAHVLGFSLGGTIGALTAARYPESVRSLTTVGMDIDMAASEKTAYEFALRRARELGHRRALRSLERIGPPPHIDARRFGVRLEWLANFGGVHRRATYFSLLRDTVWSLLRAPEYSPLDVYWTMRGIDFSRDHLLPRIADLNLRQQLPQIDVPIFMLQGKRDQAAPPDLAATYAQELRAPHGKRLIWFDESAHMPHLEEPERFRQVLLDSTR